LRWLGSLQELEHPSGGTVPSSTGNFGEYLSLQPTTGGYLAASGAAGTDAILPVRRIPRTTSAEFAVPQAIDNTIPITLMALGGAREIGANAYYYNFGHRGLLIDAGFDATRDGWLGLPAIEQITRLDAIVLTHAHLDHVGAIPVVLAAFPGIPVYCTRATLAVLFPQLSDSAKVGLIRFEKTGEAPAFSRGLADRIPVDRFRILPYGERAEIPEIPGLTIEFNDAGHIIGSAGARLEFGSVSILHTGDISVEDQHLLRGMKIDGLTVDHLVMEGTYCGEPLSNRAERRAATTSFLAAIAERLDSGGSVLVPAFSLGRAQELVGLLVDWMDRTKRSAPIWTVGLVNVLNDVSAAHPDFLPGMSGNPFARVNRFPTTFSKTKQTDEERRDDYARIFLEIARKAPSIIIASHGMMAENTGSYFIGRAILTGNDSRHSICLCGYMDPRTPGFRLRHQREEPLIDYGVGDPVSRTIPPERIQFFRLTAHASYEELQEVAHSVPKQSVTIIHGDGEGLDQLAADFRRRYEADNRKVTVRVPAIGERIALARATPSENWASDAIPRDSHSETLGPGRMFIRQTGLSIRGLSEDRRWALIPIGRDTATLALEHNRISANRIETVEIRPKLGKPSIVFDRARGVGDLSKIEWSEPGQAVWAIWARDPGGQSIPADLRLFYVAEVRPIRTALNADSPIFEFEVGGSLQPQFVAITVGEHGPLLDAELAEWDPTARILRTRLRAPRDVGEVADIHLHLRWPNGFVQRGPSLGSFTFEPTIDIRPSPSRVGMPTSVLVRSIPRPVGARIGGIPARIEEGAVHFVPKRPGSSLVELEYRTSVGDQEWREAGTLYVSPAATVELPSITTTDRDLQVIVREVAPHLHGLELGLRVGGEIIDRWIANADPHSWSGAVKEPDRLEVAIVGLEQGSTIWEGSVNVSSQLELNSARSFLVASADRSLEAELAWIGSGNWSRKTVEDAFANAGFEVVGWRDDILRLLGTLHTVGVREIKVGLANHVVGVRILTLTNLGLHLSPTGPFAPGDSATLCTKGGALEAGLYVIDGGPLSIEVDRIAPLFDGLSARANGNRVEFHHLGRYEVALVAGGRRLCHVLADVQVHQDAGLAPATKRVELTASSSYDASILAAGLAPSKTTAILWTPAAPYRILQDAPESVIETAWQFLSSSLTAKEKILVTWPGLALSPIGGQLLRRVRDEYPDAIAAQLSFPAPRGEIAIDLAQARRLRAHRVMCSVPACSSIDRLDSYPCPRCGNRYLLKTDNEHIWFNCPNCGHEDRNLILTLVGMRSSDVQILFADFRIARYLVQGIGSRYAGAYARAVRCSRCHRLQAAFTRPGPWDKSELHRLLTALASAWDPEDERGSIRRAAHIAVRRAPRSRPGDLPRHENQLRHLIDAEIVIDGRTVGTIDRLEAGTSICCDAPLIWSSRRVSHVFLDVESLLSTSAAASLHPDLPSGQAGVRQFLALAD
jgi:Cft2 family RNA processing exonuclease